jgi:hypothetical protein
MRLDAYSKNSAMHTRRQRMADDDEFSGDFIFWGVLEQSIA